MTFAEWGLLPYAPKGPTAHKATLTTRPTPNTIVKVIVSAGLVVRRSGDLLIICVVMVASLSLASAPARNSPSHTRGLCTLSVKVPDAGCVVLAVTVTMFN